MYHPVVYWNNQGGFPASWDCDIGNWHNAEACNHS